VCVFASVCVFARVCVCVCMFASVYVCVCTYVCIREDERSQTLCVSPATSTRAPQLLVCILFDPVAYFGQLHQAHLFEFHCSRERERERERENRRKGRCVSRATPQADLRSSHTAAQCTPACTQTIEPRTCTYPHIRTLHYSALPHQCKLATHTTHNIYISSKTHIHTHTHLQASTPVRTDCCSTWRWRS
jgi:hypothetical protein